MSIKVRRGVELPPYSGEEVTCPKCGMDRVKTMYRAPLGCSEPDCSVCDAEHLLRVCENCRYSWAEAPLDTAAPSGRAAHTEGRQG